MSFLNDIFLTVKINDKLTETKEKYRICYNTNLNFNRGSKISQTYCII